MKIRPFRFERITMMQRSCSHTPLAALKSLTYYSPKMGGRRQTILVAGVVMALVSARRGLPACQGLAPPPPITPMWLPSTPERRQEQRMLADRRYLGEQFVKAILTKPFEALPHHEQPRGIVADGASADDGKEMVDVVVEKEEGTQGMMRLWRNIPDLHTGISSNIVLRSTIEPFWQSCIDKVENVDNPHRRYRVCVVGTPGTGKTCTTPLLLRMLLLKGSTVVYIRRSIDRSSWFYEFVPTSNNENTNGEIAVTVNVYPEESTRYYNLPSLRKKSNYYVVDAGTSIQSCDPGNFQACVIIISPPNEKHWGANEFAKRRGGSSGTFRYYPLWNYSEVMHGLDHFSLVVRFSPQQIAERYRQVGGVPRNLFADEEEYQNILETQDNAVEAIEPDQAQWIMSGEMDPIGHLKGGVPKSAAIGIESADSEYGRFVRDKAVPISTAVAEKVVSLHPDAVG